MEDRKNTKKRPWEEEKIIIGDGGQIVPNETTAALGRDLEEGLRVIFAVRSFVVDNEIHPTPTQEEIDVLCAIELIRHFQERDASEMKLSLKILCCVEEAVRDYNLNNNGESDLRLALIIHALKGHYLLGLLESEEELCTQEN